MPRISRRHLLTSAAAAAAATTAGAIVGPYIQRRRRGRTVIFIVADAMRGDRIGRTRVALGEKLNITPHLEDLAAKGLLFTQAFSPSTWTPISMASILYDVEPCTVTDMSNLALAGAPKVATKLKEKGYVTFAAIANEVLDFKEITRGFDDHRILHTSQESRRKMKNGFVPLACKKYSPALNRAALRMIDAHKADIARSPLYLYMHYMDTHYPYNATGIPRAGHPDRLGWYNLEASYQRGVDVQINTEGEKVPIPRAIELFEEGYDSAVRTLDGNVGRLLDELAKRRLLDDALVVFTADHGEEFFDNTEVSRKTVCHNGPLVYPQTHVPLLVREFGERTYEPCVIGGPCSNRTILNRVTDAVVCDMSSDETIQALRSARAPRIPISGAINFHGNKVPPIEPQPEDEVGVTCPLGDGSYYKIVRDDLHGGYREYVMRAGKILAGVQVPPQVANQARRAVEGLSNAGAFRPEAADQKTIDNLRAVGYLL